MGHVMLKKLDGDAELWTGDAFEYLYVEGQGGEQEYHLPAEILYEQLTVELRSKVIAEVEGGAHDWVTLAAALEVLRRGRDGESDV